MKPIITIPSGLIGLCLLIGSANNGAVQSVANISSDIGDAINELGLTQEQVDNAAAIVQAGEELGVDEYGQQIAIATAIQESSLVNVGYGDDWWFEANGWGKSDSVGLFQQRDHWAPKEVRMDPVESAKLFFTGNDAEGIPGLLDTDYQAKDLTTAAADVQNPAAQYRGHYANHEGLAKSLLNAIKGGEKSN